MVFNMKKESMLRRDFLKAMGIGTVAAGAGTVVTKTASGAVVSSEEEYGNFLVEKLSDDKLPYEYKQDVLKAMSERSTVFSRNVWDPVRRSRPGSGEDLTHQNLVDGKGIRPNQTRLDYALYDGSWSLAQRGGRMCYDWESFRSSFKERDQWKPSELDMSWNDASMAVKHAGLFYGASLAGIAELNPLWLYSDSHKPSREKRDHAIPVIRDGERFERKDEAWYIPGSMNRVIALGFEEDVKGIENSPGRLASAAVGNGYSRMAFSAFCLAEFIRSLGYRAIPAGNGVGLSIPIAIDAGLGELGRMGMLVTPKYGPRVRLAKVITDMPLEADKPIRFGVTEFCEVCMLCADHCPSNSVTKGSRAWEGKSKSNNPGVFKWYVEPEPCYDYNGFSCSNCKRVCPFTKPNNSWLHKMIRIFINRRIEPLDNVMVSLDQASGYGKQLQGTDFWKQGGEKCITSRESM